MYVNKTFMLKMIKTIFKISCKKRKNKYMNNKFIQTSV